MHLGSELHNLRLHPVHPFRKPLQVRHASLQPFHSFSRLRRHQQHSAAFVRWRSPLTARVETGELLPDDDTIVVPRSRPLSDASGSGFSSHRVRRAGRFGSQGRAFHQCRISHAPHFLDGCSLSLFCSPASSHSSSATPHPNRRLGSSPGTTTSSPTYDQAIDYFRKLDAASDRLTLVETGRTSWASVSTSPSCRARRTWPTSRRYRQIAQRARASGRPADRCRRASAGPGGKARSSTSTAGCTRPRLPGGQHTLQLAHDLLAHADDPKIKPIFDNVILMLWPSINPDGQNMVAEVAHAEMSARHSRRAPLTELYQEYVGHDNNRDAYMLNMVESREMSRAWRHWEPQIIYVHHQSSPFPTRIWLPPFAEPIASARAVR